MITVAESCWLWLSTDNQLQPQPRSKAVLSPQALRDLLRTTPSPAFSNLNTEGHNPAPPPSLLAGTTPCSLSVPTTLSQSHTPQQPHGATLSQKSGTQAQSLCLTFGHCP